MSKSELKLGALELEVLKLIWERQPCTVQTLADVLGERHGYARTTILTVVQRLYAKGILKRRKRDGLYRYSAAQDRRKTMAGLIEQFVESVLDNSSAPLVAYLSDTKRLTPEQAAELRKIVDDLDDRSEAKS